MERSTGLGHRASILALAQRAASFAKLLPKQNGISTRYEIPFELRKPELPPFMSADRRREHVTSEPAPSPAPVSLVKFAAREGLPGERYRVGRKLGRRRAPSPDSRFSLLSLHKGNVDERDRPLLRTQTWDVAVQVGNHMMYPPWRGASGRTISDPISTL